MLLPNTSSVTWQYGKLLPNGNTGFVLTSPADTLAGWH